MSGHKTALVLFVISAIVTPGVFGVKVHHEEEHDAYEHEPPHYTYEYKVHDSHTGDIKSAHETREGDVVKGYYVIHDPDGTTREVHYTADKHNGFNAHVKTSGTPVYPEQHHEPQQKHHHHPHHQPQTKQHHEAHHESHHETYHSQPKHHHESYQPQTTHHHESHQSQPKYVPKTKPRYQSHHSKPKYSEKEH